MTKTFCDICGGEIEYDYWNEGLHLRIVLPHSNPLGCYGGNYKEGEVVFRDTCEECRRAIAEAIDEILTRRKK
jgi:hypothetical protein